MAKGAIGQDPESNIAKVCKYKRGTLYISDNEIVIQR